VVTSSNGSPAAGSPVTISAQLADTYGNPVTTFGQVVNWSTTFAGGSTAGFAALTSTTDTQGQATVVYTLPNTLASGTITGTTGQWTGSTVMIATVPGAVSAATSTVIAMPLSLPAGQGGTSLVTITPKDTHGNLVNDPALSFTVATLDITGASQGTITTPTYQNNGTYTATFTAGTSAGPVAIVPAIGGTAFTQTVTITQLGTMTNNIADNGGTPVNLNKTGGGTLTLTGTNTYSGTTTIADGTLQIGAGGSTGTLGTTGNVINSGVLAFNRNDTLSVANLISGTGAVEQNGTGTTTLTGTNTYTGPTTVNAGTLQVDGNQSGASGAVTVEAGAALAGRGTIGGPITLDPPASPKAGGQLQPGASGTPGVLTATSGLTFSSGSSLQWSLSANDNTAADRGTDFDGIDVSGGQLTIASGVTSQLSFNETGSSVNFADTFWATEQVWTVFSNVNVPLLASSASVFDTVTPSVDSTNKTLAQANRSTAGFYWRVSTSGAGSGKDLELVYTPNLSGVVTGLVSANPLALNADGTGPQTSTITIQPKDASNNNVNTPGLNYTFAALGANQGTLTSPAVYQNNGTYTATYTAGSQAGPVTITAKLDGVDLVHTATITLSGTMSNNITGSGGLNVTGGTLTLTGTNSYTGVTDISTGTLQIGNGGATGTLGSGPVLNGGTLAFNRDNSAQLIVANAISGSGGLQQSGTGTTVLTGSNTYTGTTQITQGTLQVGGGGTTGMLGTGAVTVTSPGTLAFNRSDTLTVSNVISGTGAVNQTGTGTTLLTAANTYTGGTTISAGTITLAANDRLPTTGAITLTGGTLDLGGFTQQTGRVTLAGGSIGTGSIIDGALLATDYVVESGSISAVLGGNNPGTLTKNTTGTVTLTGNNVYAGATQVNAGTLLVNGDQSGATGAVTVANGATLGGAGTLGGAISLNGTLQPGGSSPGVLSAADDLNLNTGSTLQWNLTSNDDAASNRGVRFDGVNVGGTLAISTGVTSALVFNGPGSGVNFNDAFWQSVRQCQCADIGVGQQHLRYHHGYGRH
jgi:autotransporter-associated beta strand protein